jgi:hypothetical protein
MSAVTAHRNAGQGDGMPSVGASQITHIITPATASSQPSGRPPVSRASCMVTVRPASRSMRRS